MKIYLSSTYNDLVDYRRQAYRAMRGLGLDVVAMEDYVARDDRPLDACLADVAAAKLYVGIFGFRYGHIPKSQEKSITELEYREAVRLNIPRLIFLARPDDWPMGKSDAFTGDGEGGELIKKFRADLQEEALVGGFGTPDQLDAAVSKGVARWLRDQDTRGPASQDRSSTAVPHQRQMRQDLLLLHAPTDADRAEALAKAVASVWSVLPSGTGLTAATGEDLKALDRQARTARAAGVLLSPAALTILAEDKDRSGRALRLARERTGILLGVSGEDIPAAAAAPWGFTEMVPFPEDGSIAAWGSGLHLVMSRLVRRPEHPQLGLPVIVVAMTAAEAGELLKNPPAPAAGLIRQRPVDWWLSRYGSSRDQWRPFESAESIGEILGKAVTALNENLDRLRGWTIMLRPYSFDPLISDSLASWPTYDDIAQHGCLAIVDELSLFDDGLRSVFAASPLADAKQVALVSLAPLDPILGTPQALVRDKLDTYLAAAAHRFSVGLDPLCEMGVNQPRRLDRWLRESLPRAAEVLREPSRDPAKLLAFSRELGDRGNPAMARLISGEVPR